MEKKDHELSPEERGAFSGGIGRGSGSSISLPLDYFKEARLFLGKDRATLTFYVEQEVASIHYDVIRDEIFYRGHNVKNMTMSQDQWLSLQKFAEYLSEDPRAGSLLQSYRSCLEHLMTHHGLPA